jgi:hypothetical protein
MQLLCFAAKERKELKEKMTARSPVFVLSTVPCVLSRLMVFDLSGYIVSPINDVLRIARLLRESEHLIPEGTVHLRVAVPDRDRDVFSRRLD